MNTQLPLNRIELWAGFEHTINRVQNRYVSQLEKMKLAQTVPDFSLIKDLKIKKFRSPFLWESIADAKDPEKLDFSFAEKYLTEIQKHGIEPIAGFLHHGSGPAFTNLLDPDFPEKFRYFAKSFAQKFPFVKFYTPINEPLTTARFSALYGHWYPHKNDDQSFIRALFHQIKATILAMKDIKLINPEAQLIQTEDLGKTQATPLLKYQMDFENERRFLSFDLLMGRVNQNHPLYGYLLKSGLTDDEMMWLQENRVIPETLGINHYLLSNRYLDEKIESYPGITPGGNGKHRYIDIGAVDTANIWSPPPETLLIETWDRFHVPLAVTEVHLRGYREDQMRWFYEIKTAAERLQGLNIPVQAVTLWSLFGAMDWNTLCTKDNLFYESGVFDVRANYPRKTALIDMAKSWPDIGLKNFPVLAQPGWWKKNRTYHYSQPILITGARGTLGQVFQRLCQKRNLSFIALSSHELDITDKAQLKTKLEEIKPWAVINAAGYVRVDQAEMDPEICLAKNFIGPKNLGEICAENDVRLLSFSSDLVFSGHQNSPYDEDHPVDPLNVYGLSKAKSEKALMKTNPKSLIVRTSSFFSPFDEYNFIYQMLKSVSQKNTFSAVNNITISPTYVPDLVNYCLDILLDNEQGLVHLANEGAITWSDFALKAIAIARKKDYDINPRYLKAISSEEMNYLAKRPSYSALTSKRVGLMGPFEEALDRYFEETRLI